MSKQKAKLLANSSVNSQIKEVIVADIGGTHIRFARVKNNKIFDFIKKETPKNKKNILKEIAEYIKKYINKNTKAIGISCAGVIENNVIKISPNLPLKNVNLKKYLQPKFKKRIEIENDANCAALAEARFGIKKKNFFVLTLGTGIGGGIIINGELYKGKNSAGEFGNMIINQRKSFEYHYKKSKNNKEKLTDILGQGIASLISVLDPEEIVLAGGMKNLGKPFLNNIKKETGKYIPQNRIPKIMWSKIKHPSLLGANLLIN
ncbi:MAG: ROK family protein [Nanoarchaeota archaeon]|nr:ROK family protein [Nanoarchaeota archaeon]